VVKIEEPSLSLALEVNDDLLEYMRNF